MLKLFRVHLYFIAADLQVSRSRKQARMATYCVIAEDETSAIRRAWEALVAAPSWREAVENPQCKASAYYCEGGVEEIA